MGPLDGKRVLITGAARGIGAALARRLHAPAGDLGELDVVLTPPP